MNMPISFSWLCLPSFSLLGSEQFILSGVDSEPDFFATSLSGTLKILSGIILRSPPTPMDISSSSMVVKNLKNPFSPLDPQVFVRLETCSLVQVVFFWTHDFRVYNRTLSNSEVSLCTVMAMEILGLTATKTFLLFDNVPIILLPKDAVLTLDL